MRSKEDRRRQYVKKLSIRIYVPKFVNPTASYRLSEVNFSLMQSLYLSEAKLKNPGDCSNFFDVLFDFNRVIKCSSSGFMIKCEMEPYNKSTVPLPYFLERMKSFGNRDLYEVSNQIEEACRE